MKGIQKHSGEDGDRVGESDLSHFGLYLSGAALGWNLPEASHSLA